MVLDWKPQETVKLFPLLQIPGGNHRSLSRTTMAREQCGAIALHYFIAGLTGLILCYFQPRLILNV